MSSKLFKILTISVLTIGIVILGIILVRAKNKKDAAIINTIENPFGLPSEDTSIPNQNTDDGDDTGIDVTIGTDTQTNPDFTTTEDSPIVKKLSDEPIAGATFISIERDIVVPEEISANLVEGYDFTGYPTLMFGDDRKEVADLKTVLNRQDPSPGLTIDNAFDTTTKNALIGFQTKHNLTPDGVVGKGTYKALNDLQGIVPKQVVVPKKETIEYARFVDRANGYVYDKTTKLNEPLVRVSNTTVAKVYEAYFSNTKSEILMRYLKDGIVENVIGKIKKSDVIPGPGVTTIGTLEIKPLSNKITFASLLPNAQKVFYLSRESSGTDGLLYDFKTGQIKKIWSSSFSEWLPQIVNENTVSLTTRASGLVLGNSYILDVKNNSQKNVIANVNGLTTNISPDGKKIIYSSYENGALKTLLLYVVTGQISDFSPTTLPEKCAWTKDSLYVYCGGPATPPPALYPDDWYKGEVLFTDMLWKVDISTNTSKIILDKSNIQDQVDITNPMVNEKQDYFIFTNKHNNNLYGIDLSRL